MKYLLAAKKMKRLTWLAMRPYLCWLAIVCPILVFQSSCFACQFHADPQAVAELSPIQQRNEIEFDQKHLISQPVAAYPRYRPGIAWQEYLRFSPDGKYIVIGGMSRPKPKENSRTSSLSTGRIELWNTESGKCTILSDNLKTHIDPEIFPVAFSPDGELLAAADTYGQIKIWDLSADKISESKVIKFVDKDRNSGIATALAFTPDSKRVLIGAYPTHQMEIASAKEIKLTEQYSSSILDPDVIELSPDGNFIVFGGLGTGIQFFDRSAGQFSEAFKQKSLFKQIYFYQFMPLGESSVVAGCPPFGVPMVAINDNLTGMITDSIAFATEFPAVAIALNGSTLAVTDAKIKKSETYLEWQKEFEEADDYLPTLISLWRIKGGKLDYLGQINTGNEEIVTAIGLSPDGKTLVTSGANLRFWDIGAIRNGNRVGSK